LNYPLLPSTPNSSRHAAHAHHIRSLLFLAGLVLSDHAESQGKSAMMDFVSIGIKSAEIAVFPSSVEGAPLQDVLAGFYDVHLLSSRGNARQFTDTFPSDNLATITTVLLPGSESFIYGGFYGQARRWLPEDTAIHNRWES
jgi:hypothetical protein